MQTDYISMQHDRSHLNQGYELSIFPSFESPLQTLDLTVIIINLIYFLVIFGIFICKNYRRPKPTRIFVQKPQKNNLFPYFNLLKNQRKGKNRENINRQSRDHNHVELICQKCKYITQINEKNLINSSDKN